MEKTIESVEQFLLQEGFTKYSLFEDDNSFVLDALKENGNGIYVFVVNQDCPPINYNEFINELFNLPNTNSETKIDENGNVHFKKDRVFYVGADKEIKSRIREHITHAEANKNISLKLGNEKRKVIKKYLDVYVLPCAIEKARNMKKFIHERFRAYFGAK